MADPNGAVRQMFDFFFLILETSLDLKSLPRLWRRELSVAGGESPFVHVIQDTMEALVKKNTTGLIHK